MIQLEVKARDIVARLWPLQARFLLTDTASVGVDFIPLISTLTFDSKSTGRLCGVVASIIDDNIGENDEVFTVALQAGNSSNVIIGRSLASVTIVSDDGEE